MLGINSCFWTISKRMQKGETHKTRGLWRVSHEEAFQMEVKTRRSMWLANWQWNTIHSFKLTFRYIDPRRGGGQGAQINAASTSDSLPGRWSPKVCCFACLARIQIWKAAIRLLPFESDVEVGGKRCPGKIAPFSGILKNYVLDRFRCS